MCILPVVLLDQLRHWDVATGLPCLQSVVQAYQVWLETEHDALIISNNDVLVPDGVIDDLLHALTAEGTLSWPLHIRHSA